MTIKSPNGNLWPKITISKFYILVNQALNQGVPIADTCRLNVYQAALRLDHTEEEDNGIEN